MNRELDCLIIGFAIGALLFLWVGYWLRVRVERWHTRSTKAFDPYLRKTTRGSARSIPFGQLSEQAAPEQSARRVMRRAAVMPIAKQRQPVPTLTDSDAVPTHVASRSDDRPWTKPPKPSTPVFKFDPTVEPPGHTHYDVDPDRVCVLCEAEAEAKEAKETALAIRRDALAALTGAGYKKTAAEAALDECTMTERASGLEHWVAAAFRRLAATPK